MVYLRCWREGVSARKGNECLRFSIKRRCGSPLQSHSYSFGSLTLTTLFFFFVLALIVYSLRRDTHGDAGNE